MFREKKMPSFRRSSFSFILSNLYFIFAKNSKSNRNERENKKLPLI